MASNLSREMQREQLDEAIGDKPAKHAQARQQVKEMLICKGAPRLMCHMQLATESTDHDMDACVCVVQISSL